MLSYSKSVLSGMPVVVPQAEALGMIGVIRSLGRAGLEVHALSAKKDALGFRSNFASFSCLCPPVDHVEFPEWLKNYCDQRNIQLLIPTESVILAIIHHLDLFSNILPVSLDQQTLTTAFSKARMQMLFEERGLTDNIPSAFVCTLQNAHELKEVLSELDFPVYVKTDAIDSISETEKSSTVYPATTADEISKVVEKNLHNFSHVLVQGNRVGQGAGVNCLRWDDQYPVVMANFCDHETPHTGGLSTMRSTYTNAAMQEDAKKRLDALGWQGVAMVEYKLDRETGSFSCIEINARFWAALHLCLFAGADFPYYLAAAHKNMNFKIPDSWASIVCCHDVPGEVAYISSLLNDTDVSSTKKITSIIEFLGMYLNPRLHFDLSFKGDRKLYFINLARFLGVRI